MFSSSSEKEAEARETLRASAAALIPQIVAERAGRLEALRAVHETDKASYRFRCERYGDFLAMFVERGPEDPVHLANRRKMVASVPLIGCRLIMFTPGREPSDDGVVTFGVHPGS